jgi:D-threo-aldose 1-dehydrogenase
VRFFDTAPHYGHTKAEHRLGNALRKYPREANTCCPPKSAAVLCRARHPYDGSEGWQNPLPFEAIYDYTHDGILRSFEDSQQRLGIVDIDILLIHDIGRVTHGDRKSALLEATDRRRRLSRARRRCARAGAVKAVGLGVNEGAAILETMAEFDIDCALLAGRYTLLEQDTLDDLLPACEARGVSILLGGAFNSGILARGVQGRSEVQLWRAPQEVIERVARLEAVCRAHGVPLGRCSAAVSVCAPGRRHGADRRAQCEELRENVASFDRNRLPAGLWTALRDEGSARSTRACAWRLTWRCASMHTSITGIRHRGDYGWLTPDLEIRCTGRSGRPISQPLRAARAIDAANGCRAGGATRSKKPATCWTSRATRRRLRAWSAGCRCCRSRCARH